MGIVIMQSVKDKLHQIVESMPENDVLELIEYVGFMKRKRQQSVFKDLVSTSETSLSFWDNELDDEVWNDA
jgi:REP element-mobilizing transposase RayT